MQLDIMEENQHQLYIACEASMDNLWYPNFDFFFGTV